MAAGRSQLGDLTFTSEITESSGERLVFFTGAWCQPCLDMSPVIDEFVGQHSGLRAFDVDVDIEPDLASRYQVMSIPTVILYVAGVPKARTHGVQTLEELEATIGNALS